MHPCNDNTPDEKSIIKAKINDLIIRCSGNKSSRPAGLFNDLRSVREKDNGLKAKQIKC